MQTIIEDMAMKRIVLLLMGVLPLLASAQKLAKKGMSADEIVPQGVNYDKVEGDLNKDGRSDLVICAKSMLAIYFATPSGGYEQWKQYDDLLPADEEDDTFFVDITMKINDRGTLTISVGGFASAGTSYNSHNNYAYRFQDGDFYKIGEEQHSMSRMTGKAETVSYNYLTHKCLRTKENVFDEKVKPKSTWSTIPKKPLKKLGEEDLTY